MKALILTVSAGAGHIKAAQALKECIELGDGDEAIVVDSLKYINPLVDKIVVGSYMKMIEKTPYLYGKLYKFAEEEEGVGDFSKTVNRILNSKLYKLVKNYDADLIICTHPFPQEMMSILAQRKKMDAPIVSVLTDYAPHTFWIHSNIDAYIIPHEDLKFELIKKGVREDLIHPFGIPISPKFSQEVDKEAVRAEFGLEDKTTFLLMGGSLGMGEIKTIFNLTLEHFPKVQIICVAGKNEALREELKELAAKYPKSKSVILSFTDKISELMSVSNLLITKPGGLTISEAMAKGLPMAIISPIPGQEERNAEYLLNSGMAVWLRDSNHYHEYLVQLLTNPLRLEQMSQIAKLKSKPNSCSDTVEFLRKIFKKNRKADLS
jgi:processive 1,2-diacylglycerol beta-glucosyltransferase